MGAAGSIMPETELSTFKEMRAKFEASPVTYIAFPYTRVGCFASIIEKHGRLIA